MRLRRALVLGLTTLTLGCNCGPAEAPTAHGRLAQAYTGRVLFDAQEGHTLEGQTLPAAEDSDEAPKHRLFIDGVDTGRVVREARYFPGNPSRRLVIDAAGVLGHEGPGPFAPLAEEVLPGFDLAAACRCVVFVRGEAYEGKLERLSLDELRVETISDGLAPLWLPAVSPDGREVAVVSGHDGEAAIWRLPLTGGPAVRVTAAGQPFPEGPAPMLWTEAGLFFYAQGASYFTSLSGATRRGPGLAPPRWVERPARLQFGDGPPRSAADAARELTP
jgi:hypothetical protein